MGLESLQLGGIVGTEWLIIIIALAILLFGAKKIPEIARAVGRAMGEFQRGRQEIERELREATRPPPVASEQGRLVRIARELGIEPEGLTEQQLKEEIKRRLEVS